MNWALETYGKIWEADAQAKEKNLNPEQRLTYHQQHSLPAMRAIRDWGEAKLAADDFEEHSALGKAIKYFLRHYDQLILFCVEPGALIDNNRMEEKLKIVIRGRKTAHFYKTVNGAGVANVLISLIATTYGAGENVYDFLLALQKHKQHVNSNPANWFPWNYKKALEAIELATKIPSDDQLKT